MTGKPDAATRLLSGTCENCWRDRDDLFFHEQDEAFYCVDVLRCEARFEVRDARGDFDDWLPSDKSAAHVTSPTERRTT